MKQGQSLIEIIFSTIFIFGILLVVVRAVTFFVSKL